MNRKPQLLITAEHAGNRVPAGYAHLFADHQDVLDSHRGWDPGSLPLARAIAKRSGATLRHFDVTRLLIEPNRSLHHRAAFSEFTRTLPRDERQRIIDRYYTPHRAAIIADIERLIDAGQTVLHVGVHTFTPRLSGRTRQTEIGLLYDPARPLEKTFCRRWRDALRARAADAGTPKFRVRFNYPYRGNTDGLTTTLRKHFKPADYLGIELEVNQKLLDDEQQFPPKLTEVIVESLVESIESSVGV